MFEERFLPRFFTGSVRHSSPCSTGSLRVATRKQKAHRYHRRKVLHLGPDRAGNPLEVVSVLRKDGTEIVIHAMRMRRIYESFLRETGDPDG
jgi:hypothetical protein